MDGGGGGRFPILQASRDPESNWEVDVAKSLEEYLLKICSGEDPTHSVNFAEGEEGFLRLGILAVNVQDQQGNGSAPAKENDLSTIPNEDDIFLGLNDVPVEAKITLDNNVDRDDLQRKVTRPPANLLVFEGDCLDSEASELDSYLLATCNFYGNFLLLDPCDAPAVFDFLQGKSSGKENSAAHQRSSVRSIRRTSAFTSPDGRSVGTGRRLNPEEGQGDPDPTQEKNPDQSQGINENETQQNISNFSLGGNDWSYDDMPPSDGAAECPDDGDDSDEEDPWRPLDPHEPGNLKIRPYRRGHVTGTPEKKTLASLFPMAKMDVINLEQAKSFGTQQSQQEEINASQSPPYEKLMRSLEFGEQENCYVFGDLKDDGGFNNGANDYDDNDEPEIPYDMDPMDVDDIINPSKDKNPPLDETQGTQSSLDEHENLDDLCRSHRNGFLASIAEEQQSEMDARVSTWKERIEVALEEQDKNPPFDIGSYGEQILDTLSSTTDNTGIASFGEIVSCRPKYEVNGRSVDLDKGHVTNEVVCYTADNSFHVKLVGPNRRPEMEARFAQKRVKSPLQNCGKGSSDSPLPPSQQKSLKKQSHRNGKVPVKTSIRLTPDGKRRRRSAHLVQPLNLESSQ
ncbi:hypothetical protein PR202_ga29817 [Eleusine coracana subsp. coracana]|uniref:Condensin-2 complex subunit H2 n=1 Tax=Eleusine coracana subsp. coracana TaxID=191504 RepID=A0AAV5DN66_ELECO|nr:hypothetical protein PR202_ga29817 [Eleusine coracana subsp. coracana]